MQRHACPTYFRDGRHRRGPRADRRPGGRRRAARAGQGRSSSRPPSRSARAWSSTEADYEGVEVDAARDRGRPTTRSTQWVERLQPPVRRARAGRAARRRRATSSPSNMTVTRDGEPLEAARPARTTSTPSAPRSSARPSTRSSPARSPATSSSSTTSCPRAVRRGAGRRHAASFRVLVKDVKALALPDADDAFAQTASEFDTIDELRDDLREKLDEAKEREAEGVIRDRALQAMVDRVDVELPELADRRRDRRTGSSTPRSRPAATASRSTRCSRSRAGTAAASQEDSRDHAVRAIKADLVLEGVARADEIEVTAEELGAEIGSAGPGVRPRSEGTGEATRPHRTDRDAGRGYHPYEGARHLGRTRRYHRGEPREETRRPQRRPRRPDEEAEETT